MAASQRKFCRRCLNPWVFKFHRTSRRHFLLKSAGDIAPLTALCVQIESLLRLVMVIFSGRQIIQSVTEVVSSPASSRALPSLERLLVPCLLFAIVVQPPDSFELTWGFFSLARSCATSHVSTVWASARPGRQNYPCQMNQNGESIQPPLQCKRKTVQLLDPSRQSQFQGSVSWSSASTGGQTFPRVHRISIFQWWHVRTTITAGGFTGVRTFCSSGRTGGRFFRLLSQAIFAHEGQASG